MFICVYNQRTLYSHRYNFQGALLGKSQTEIPAVKRKHLVPFPATWAPRLWNEVLLIIRQMATLLSQD